MKFLIIVKYIVLFLAFYPCTITARAQKMEGMNVQTKSKKPSYTCPMHPDVHSDKPGACPKCGMNLVEEKSKEVMQMNGMDMPNNIKADAASIPQKYIYNNAPPKVTHYDLYIKDTIVNFSGKKRRAIAANGQIPMPPLTFTEGDTAEIVVHNLMIEGTTLHWHGLFLDNQYDGVANLTQKPIPPGGTFTYRFPIKQSGTHWYHSHFMLQEQIGMYGSMTLLSRKELDIPTIPVILSEWSDVKPEEIHRRLYAASDWFSIQKGTTQSYGEALVTGHFKTKLQNEWKRMHAMDVSDVYYNKFLVNGAPEKTYDQFKAGDKVRLRIANGGASSYFWLSYAGGKITVVANDGNDVVPVEVDRLLVSVSETYDVIVTIPQNKQYEFLVTPEDRTKYASIWLGSGDKVSAAKLPKLKYFEGMKMMNNMMDNKGNVIEMQGMAMQNQVMDMNTMMYPEITGPANGKESSMMKMIEKNYDKVKEGDKDTTSVKMQDTKMDANMQMDHSKMDHGNMQMTNGKMSMMDMDAGQSGIVTLNYNMLKATEKTTLPPGELRTLNFDLTGNMDRYVWTLNNKTISESDKILIHKVENLRIILFNNSMMRHPMHLHGHDFRVLNGQGDYSPLKNVLDIMPMERDTIEFAADASGGDWFFHCHVLYHMMSGMGRIFSYTDGIKNPEVTDSVQMSKALKQDDKRFHLMAEVAVQNNGSDGNVMLSNTRFKVSEMWHLGYHDEHGYESETMFGRYLGRMQWWFPYVGFDYHYKKPGGPKNIFGNEEKTFLGQNSNELNRKTITAGITYTLPMLVLADARIDGNGQFRFQLSRNDIPVTARLRLNWMINTDKEYMAGLRYIVGKYISIGTHYDSDMGIGAGVVFTY
ncbi:MAG: multicopper oxidase domain-containing protein [Ferruginibacter sp.]